MSEKSESLRTSEKKNPIRNERKRQEIRKKRDLDDFYVAGRTATDQRFNSEYHFELMSNVSRNIMSKPISFT